MAIRIALLTALATVAGVVAQTGKARIGTIDFFGYTGLDIYVVRATLQWREGDVLPSSPGSSEESKATVRARVREAIGREPTDVAFVCCDSQQGWMLYIGLPGDSRRRPSFNPVPDADIRFPQAIVTLRQELDDASFESIKSGIAEEDRSQGFALSEYPPAREKQLALRRYALQDEALILRVLGSSSDARHRAIAAQALGYGSPSRRQVEALVRASLDADDGVRNDAIRALAVLARTRPELARRIPVRTFIALLRSGTWSDLNKASLLLESLTAGRNPQVLRELRSDAMDALTEMARWKSTGHAFGARMILGRIAGIDEKRLFELATTGQTDAILRGGRL